ncbi:glycosyltransferase family 2 protein [Dickeya dadantii]|uniref:Glycosyl transferase, group 2 family protein n=1 Tax=Dickeya dadantii (strain 3937) TaxID=198628 RepID=E0SFU9_DICD3|nr:glycosyltransferase family 2 protein [Dickeya dadantii]ADM97622.1 Glycosyl transferase, group 2 family protein [Dickeya dadantii 3937]
MKITAVVVTYANRFDYVKQVVDECFSQGVNKVVIIDNGSPRENNESLLGLQEEYTSERVFLVTNKKNEGSAVGFSQGIRFAVKFSEPDSWILILDDDNKLEPGAVKKLNSLSEKHGSDNAYMCLRFDRIHYKKYLITKERSVLLGEPNAFMLFSLLKFIKKKLGVRKESVNWDKFERITEPVECPCGPYGGLFISIKAINKVGFPNEKLYLYFDDTEYTLRFKEKGVNLWLAPQARIRDIDESWSGKKLSKKFSHPSLEADEFRVKYTYRNRVYMERKYFVTSKFEYFLNAFFYLSFLGVKAVFSRSIKRYFVICKSVYEGWNFDKNIDKLK